METVVAEAAPSPVSGFWRRLAAFAIDSVVLGVFGMIAGFAMFDTLAQLGPYGRLLGFAVALLYFGVLNSRIGGGQTLGKRALSIRAVTLDGQLMSVPRSLLRYGVSSSTTQHCRST
ncbi:RDD family protein [Lysobacter tyrosinilyticus]